MNPLAAAIAEEIRAAGPITFARFMALALYDPRHGYYTGGSERDPIGWRGDFFTSGDVHPLWGWSLARLFYQMWLLLGRPERFDVLEPGAGRGLLIRETWRYALERAPDFAAVLHYTAIDAAPAISLLRREREERLAAELAALGVPEGRVRWVESLPDAAPQPVTGCVVSNELFDALPVHVVEKRGDRLHEVYVALGPDGGFIETLGEPSTPEVAAYLDHYRVPWRRFHDGWRGEVALDVEPWMRIFAAALRRGFVLTIDYGDLASKLYIDERKRGTLASYARHRMGDDPLAQPGRQDLTAHVNFSALLEHGRASGLRRALWMTQAELLEKLRIREEARTLASRLYPYAETERHTDRGQMDYLRQRALLGAVSTLLNPYGLGGFHALLQQKGMPGAGRALLRDCS